MIDTLTFPVEISVKVDEKWITNVFNPTFRALGSQGSVIAVASLYRYACDSSAIVNSELLLDRLGYVEPCELQDWMNKAAAKNAVSPMKVGKSNAWNITPLSHSVLFPELCMLASDWVDANKYKNCTSSIFNQDAEIATLGYALLTYLYSSGYGLEKYPEHTRSNLERFWNIEFKRLSDLESERLNIVRDTLFHAKLLDKDVDRYLPNTRGESMAKNVVIPYIALATSPEEFNNSRIFGAARRTLLVNETTQSYDKTDSEWILRGAARMTAVGDGA